MILVNMYGKTNVNAWTVLVFALKKSKECAKLQKKIDICKSFAKENDILRRKKLQMSTIFVSLHRFFQDGRSPEKEQIKRQKQTLAII